MDWFLYDRDLRHERVNEWKTFHPLMNNVLNGLAHFENLAAVFLTILERSVLKG